MFVLYISLFYTYIMYCTEKWGNSYATNVNCLVLLDRKVVRFPCGAERLYGFLVVQKGCTVSLWCRKVVRFPCGAERLYGFLVVQKGCTVSLWCRKVVRFPWGAERLYGYFVVLKGWTNN